MGEYGEEEDEEVLEPDNPLYARIRMALQKQLEEQQLRLHEELREKEEDLKRLKKKKEDVGVELYGVQQQLARMQLTLEKTHDNFNTVRRLREEAEEEAHHVMKEYDKKQIQVSEQARRMAKFQTELDKLSATLQQVETYNEQMKGEIAITRRATYKAEEQVQQLEGQKKQQDLLIEDLMRSSKLLQDRLDLLSTQHDSQQDETRAAQQVLKEAQEEMDKIRQRKKELLLQWKSALLAVSRRDEHLQSVEKALREVQQEEQTMHGEISSFKQSIRKEQDRNEAVSAILSKVRSSAAYLEKQLDQVRQDRQRMQEQYVMLKRSLEQSDAELGKVDQEKKMVLEETTKVEKVLAATANETQGMEAQILSSLADQTTLQKAAQSTDKQTQSMQAQMHSKENQVAQVRNELSRIKVDALNTTAHNDQLKVTVKDIDEELKRKEQLVLKYELEIRRRNDEIEKKMRDLDSLNRKYEALRQKFEAQAGADAAVVGPLEATIKSLRNEIDQKRRVCNDLQRMWMGTQTELVKLSNEASQQSERVAEIKAQTAVLTQKRVRVEGQVRVQEKEVSELKASIASMHTDMAKLNDLIGRNQSKYATLEGNNFTLEADFANSLKDLEEQAVRLEVQVKSTLEEKERIKEELVEKEREIMTVERKIEVEKETQAAYSHKDEGAEVTEGMKREIHRMQLRYSQLMRRQEELMVDMERAIFKRDAIGIRGKLKQHQAKTQGGTRAELKRVVADLTRRVADMEGEVSKYDKQARALDQQGKELAVHLEEAGAMVREVQREEDEVHEQMFNIDKQKKHLKESLLLLQKHVKRYQALEQGKSDQRPPEEVAEGLARADERRALLMQVVEQLAGSDERAAASLRPVLDAAPLLQLAPSRE